MRLLIRTIGLAILLTCPVELSAQVVPYPVSTSPSSRVVPTAYEQPVAAQSADAEPPLSPPKPQNQAGHAEPLKSPSGIQTLLQVGGSLAVVLGIFFLVVWVLRRTSPGGLGTLPAGAFEVLGRAALANRQQVHLLRCGNKLLLVSVTATGAQTLTEITDPAEVDRLSELCRQTRSNVAATVLGRVFRQAEARDA
jgi:flagellar biogenesis protein FliO